jgi:hypothetical protein
VDGDRFDELSRLLAGAVSRQSVFRLLIGAGVSGLAALAGDRDGERPVLETEAKKKKRKKRKRRKGRSNGRCPDQHDRVCHCPPGNTDNCHTTGDGGGHENDELDCCCTRNGRRNPRCSCDGNECCKPAGTTCANSSQCCDGIICINIVGGIGVCADRGGCQALTCADFPDRCGPQDDGCGGQTIACVCPDPTDDCVGGVCVGPSCEPLTCADFPDQCGTFADGCDGEIDCACASGGCCDGVCEDGAACCQANDCPRQLCQDRACNDGTCEYTPVEDGEPGPLCTGQGRLCCDGDCLSDGQCCTVQDCQEQACQTVECVDSECVYTPVQDGGQGPLCTGSGDFCCNGDACCEAGALCLDFGCCIPETMDESCAGSSVDCGMVSDGCGGEYDCGTCVSGLTCIAGACLPSGGRRKKRCKGKGLASQPCKGKKCKCKGGRNCHNGKCCETRGDGSRHCNANSDCCPGLTCIRKFPDQHKVCRRKGAGSSGVDLLSSLIRTDEMEQDVRAKA